MTQHRRALAGALLSLPLALSVAACGGGNPPTDTGTSTEVTGSPAVGVEEGETSSPSTSPTSTADPSIAAVIGSWAAQYGVARNTVQTAMADLGSAAQGGGDVKAAATALLTALRQAEGLAPSPDPATEDAFRQDLKTLTADATTVSKSGDAAAAKQLAGRAGTAFQATETALTAAYG